MSLRNYEIFFYYRLPDFITFPHIFFWFILTRKWSRCSLYETSFQHLTFLVSETFFYFCSFQSRKWQQQSNAKALRRKRLSIHAQECIFRLHDCIKQPNDWISSGFTLTFCTIIFTFQLFFNSVDSIKLSWLDRSVLIMTVYFHRNFLYTSRRNLQFR